VDFHSALRIPRSAFDRLHDIAFLWTWQYGPMETLHPLVLHPEEQPPLDHKNNKPDDRAILVASALVAASPEHLPALSESE
jgi:hypothetical protein